MTSSPIEKNENLIQTVEQEPEAEEKKRRFAFLYNRPWKKVILIVIALLLAVAIAAVSTVAVLYQKGKDRLLANSNVSMTMPNNSEIEVDMEDDGTVIYKGEKYVFNESVTSMLAMGVDKKRESDYVKGFKGQADAIFLVVIDTDTGKTTVVAIPRDIMAEVEVYSKNGAYSGIETHQICTAYAYGDGAEVSCERMVTAVSRLMYGIPINTYFSMEWTAIGVLNDLVGGVTVPEYDSNWNPTGGTVTLRGQKALDYIQKRSKDSNGSSNRLERQINYLKAFANKTVEKMKKDITVPLKMYNTLNKHSVNSIDASKITYLSKVFMNGGADLSFETVKGEITEGEKFVEMYVDEQALYDMVIRLFYEKKE